MKHDTFEKYRAENLELAQRALLTTWDCLADYRNDLVLVGGLAIRHLTHPPGAGLPGPVTLDVDFGIHIAASNGCYPGIRDILSGHGFRWEGKRFVRQFKELTLYIDLLTDDDKSEAGAAIVDDNLAVSIVPGISRALACHRCIEIVGQTLLGAQQTERIKVAEVGPLLVLKLNAFGGPIGRKAPKDAHDILYLATKYLDGVPRAIAGFEQEKREANRGMESALRCLRSQFAGPDAPGPLACAAFRLNNRHLEPSLAEESMQIRQQCVTLAQALLS